MKNNLYKKLLVVILLILVASYATILVACAGDDEENTSVYVSTEVHALDELIANQEVDSARVLVNYGFEQDDIVFTYHIGNVNGAFVGFLTSEIYYSGIGTSELSYEKSESSTVTEAWSISNIKSITNEVNVSAEIKWFSAGYSYAWTTGSEETFGQSFSDMISQTESISYQLTPEMGEGRYCLVAFSNYSIYETIYYDINSSSISESVIYFTNSYNSPQVSIYLVKADEYGKYNTAVDDNINITTVDNIYDSEIMLAETFAATYVMPEYYIMWGNDYDRKDKWFSSKWDGYEKLDTLSRMLDYLELDIVNINNMYDRVEISLNYNYWGGNLSNTQVRFRIYNETTGVILDETGADNLTGSVSFSFNTSDISEGDIIYIEIDHRKINGWGCGDITIYQDREYSISFY